MLTNHMRIASVEYTIIEYNKFTSNGWKNHSIHLRFIGVFDGLCFIPRINTNVV